MKLLSVFAAALAISNLAQAADLNVEVAGLKQAKGKVFVAVYNRAEDFLKQPMRTATADAQPGKVTLLIAGLPPGDYALSVFHDENANGKLDTNLIGMPVEPYGFSNDASGNYGPPSFKQSLLHVPEAGATATVNLR
ncbi:DUF2141 domain-containing protein [Janthinobacterium sp. Mn2066]|uniref:DUF2141 domain-containing protein n=1 Tax=Janthinobacterium sp. Mn2066 TaxID=3395264 RepID=UPI003BDC5C66